MHEMGIVLHLAKTLDELAEEQHITAIGSVTLQVGEVSGILTDLFEEAWDYFKKRHPILKDSRLILETIPAVTYCTNCEGQYGTVQYGKTCPYCGSGETYLLYGNECMIKEIEAETEEDGSEPVEDPEIGEDPDFEEEFWEKLRNGSGSPDDEGRDLE